MIGVRNGMGQVVVADPGATGPMQKEPRPPKRGRRKVPKNVKGLRKRKKG